MFSFYIYSNPNTPNALDVKWPQYNKDTQQYMSIKPNMTVKNKLRPDKMGLWNHLIPIFFRKSTTRKDSSDFTEETFSSPNTNDISKQLIII